MSSKPSKVVPGSGRQLNHAVHACPVEPPKVPITCDALFATTGSIGIVDLGASQTVVVTTKLERFKVCLITSELK